MYVVIVSSPTPYSKSFVSSNRVVAVASGRSRCFRGSYPKKATSVVCLT